MRHTKDEWLHAMARAMAGISSTQQSSLSACSSTAPPWQGDPHLVTQIAKAPRYILLDESAAPGDRAATSAPMEWREIVMDYMVECDYSVEIEFDTGSEVASSTARMEIAAASPQEAVDKAFTHQSIIKTTFLLYLAWPFGMMAACDEMGAASITGRWKLSA
jgi:hypothetical protein